MIYESVDRGERNGAKAATAEQESHRKSKLVGRHVLFLLALCKLCSLYREKKDPSVVIGETFLLEWWSTALACSLTGWAPQRLVCN
jgi:hypothetical protein